MTKHCLDYRVWHGDDCKPTRSIAASTLRRNRHQTFKEKDLLIFECPLLIRGLGIGWCITTASWETSIELRWHEVGQDTGWSQRGHATIYWVQLVIILVTKTILLHTSLILAVCKICWLTLKVHEFSFLLHNGHVVKLLSYLSRFACKSTNVC